MSDLVTNDPALTAKQVFDLAACRYYRCKAKRGEPCVERGGRSAIHTIRCQDAQRIARFSGTNDQGGRG